MRERGGIPGVLKLGHQFRVGDDLARVATGQLEEPTREGGFVDLGEEEDVA